MNARSCVGSCAFMPVALSVVADASNETIVNWRTETDSVNPVSATVVVALLWDRHERDADIVKRHAGSAPASPLECWRDYRLTERGANKKPRRLVETGEAQVMWSGWLQTQASVANDKAPFDDPG